MKKLKLHLLFVLVFFLGTIYSQGIKYLAPETYSSIFIQTFSKKDSLLCSATGFIIKSRTQYYLVTNWHVVTNKNAWNKQWCDTAIHEHVSPYYIKIFSSAKKINNRKKNSEAYTIEDNAFNYEILYDEHKKRRWHEDSLNGEMVDVIELPLQDTDFVIMPVWYNTLAAQIDTIEPSDVVFVVGFPLGLASYHRLPIWKPGFISSEPQLDWDNKPIMLVDINSFPGMSGSPVYFKSDHIHGELSSKKIGFFVGVFSEEQLTTFYGAKTVVYGMVWKASYLRPIFKALP